MLTRVVTTPRTAMKERVKRKGVNDAVVTLEDVATPGDEVVTTGGLALNLAKAMGGNRECHLG